MGLHGDERNNVFSSHCRLTGTAMAADVGDVLLTLAFDLALSFSSVERGSLTRCVTLRHNNPMGAPNLNQHTSPPSKGECLYVKCHEVSKLSVRICRNPLSTPISGEEEYFWNEWPAELTEPLTAAIAMKVYDLSHGWTDERGRKEGLECRMWK